MRPTPIPFVQNDNTYTPMRSIATITPSDSVDVPNGPTMGIIFNNTAGVPAAAGNVSLVMADGSTATLYVTSNWYGVQYLQVLRVNATGTTYTGAIFGVW